MSLFFILTPAVSAQDQPPADNLWLGPVKHRIEFVGGRRGNEVFVDFAFANHNPSKNLALEAKWEFIGSSSGIQQANVPVETKEGEVKDLRIFRGYGTKTLIITLTLLEVDEGGKIARKSNQRYLNIDLKR